MDRSDIIWYCIIISVCTEVRVWCHEVNRFRYEDVGVCYVGWRISLWHRVPVVAISGCNHRE